MTLDILALVLFAATAGYLAAEINHYFLGKK